MQKDETPKTWRIYSKALKGGESNKSRSVRADKLVVADNGSLSFVRADTVILVVPFGQFARCELKTDDKQQ